MIGNVIVIILFSSTFNTPSFHDFQVMTTSDHLYYTFDLKAKPLNKLKNFGCEYATSRVIRPTDLNNLELPPPVVINDEQLSDQSSYLPADTKKERSEIVDPLEYQEEPKLRNEEFSIYYDAREYISNDGGAEDDSEEQYTLPVQIYTSQYKSPRRESQCPDCDSFSSQWLSDHVSGGGHISKQNSTRTMDTTCWSMCTVYTWSDQSDCSNETTLVSDVSEEGKRQISSHSECSLSKSSTLHSLPELGPDTRSRHEIFAKGVPWGFHGRDYLPPPIKCHSLRETMRRDSEKSKHIFPRLIVNVKNQLRKNKWLNKRI